MSVFDFVKTAVSLVNDDNHKNLLFNAWEDGLVDTVQMARLLWHFQISSKDFSGFNLKDICARKTVEKIEYGFGISLIRAERLSYASTRSYITEDDMIEIMHGMHEDVLKGELGSHCLS